ncbi:hypothetical protein GALMADRAFT_143123 [Galerina marginata CBS 339.88]|uniref:DUF6534 domain-containing protein n=1 Tax=Galerina marginata (strain CBS 339.88) TaxID=685588 RepID=A0A067SMV2_GALM3|nr:hypothetical protein GALMADRAFT_143123 [Galerina marginata CBS 339.88]
MPTVEDIDISSGVDGIFAGFVLSTALLGVTILQAWTYVNHNNDDWKLRTLVAVLVVSDILSTIFNSIFIHEYLVQHFGNFLRLFTVSSGILAEFLITIIVIFIVQLFFASRVYLLNRKNIWAPAIIVITAVLGFGSGIFTIVKQFQHRQVADLALPAVRISVGFDQAMILISDGVATVALSMSFAKARSSSRVKRSITMLQDLLAYTVTRGLLVTLLDVVFMIMFAIDPTNLNWMPIHLSLSKFYVITTIAILNGRPSAQASRNAGYADSESVQISSTFATRTANTATLRAPEYALQSFGNKTFVEDNVNDSKNILVTQEKSVYNDDHKFTV